MSIMLIDSVCPHCKTKNWVADYGPDDITTVEISAIECYICSKSYWIDEYCEDIYPDYKPQDLSEKGFATPIEALK